MMQSLLVLSSVVGASMAAITLTTDGCADASGLQHCLDLATTVSESCLKQAIDTEAVAACNCALYETSYNCYSTSCWNRVWECEYQAYVVEYLDTCPVAKTPIPYFPIPDDAEDACSCNLGEVYEGIYPPLSDVTTCSINAGLVDGFSAQEAYEKGCQCCEMSALISNAYGICPDTDQSYLLIPTLLAEVENSYGFNFTDCADSLSQYDCVSDLGFTNVAGGTFYSPDDLPTTATQSLSNGPGTVTAPASGSVFTYTNGADSQVYTITAASVGKAGSAKTTTAKGSDATGSSTDSTGSAGTGSPTATGSGSTSTSSTGKNSGDVLRANAGLVAGLLLGCLYLTHM